jgi:hypothetical protein
MFCHSKQPAQRLEPHATHEWFEINMHVQKDLEYNYMRQYDKWLMNLPFQFLPHHKTTTNMQAEELG